MSRIVAALVAAALLLTGCTGRTGSDVSASPTAGDISLIEVGPSESLAPKITWPAGLTFSKTQTTVVWTGEGEALVDGQQVLLDIFIESLDSHTVLKNTFDYLPQAYLLAPELLGDDLYNVLRTATVGTRVLSVAPPMGDIEGMPSIVIVIDVLSDKAVGEELAQNPDLPLVTALASGEPEVSLDPDQKLPVELKESTLILGDGPQVEKGSHVLAQFKAVYTTDGTKTVEKLDGTSVTKTWKAGDVRQSTWLVKQAPFEGQIGVGKSLRGWDEGLIDQTAGSRVMLVVPEEWGYPGEGTIVYVIDILDVWNEPS